MEGFKRRALRSLLCVPLVLQPGPIINLFCAFLLSLNVWNFWQFSLRFLAFGPLETAGGLVYCLLILAILRWKCHHNENNQREWEVVQPTKWPHGAALAAEIKTNKQSPKTGLDIRVFLNGHFFPLITYQWNSNVTAFKKFLLTKPFQIQNHSFCLQMSEPNNT